MVTQWEQMWILPIWWHMWALVCALCQSLSSILNNLSLFYKFFGLTTQTLPLKLEMLNNTLWDTWIEVNLGRGRYLCCDMSLCLWHCGLSWIGGTFNRCLPQSCSRGSMVKNVVLPKNPRTYLAVVLVSCFIMSSKYWDVLKLKMDFILRMDLSGAYWNWYEPPMLPASCSLCRRWQGAVSYLSIFLSMWFHMYPL